MDPGIARAGCTHSKPAKRRFQFGLKLLVIATLICGILMGTGFVAWGFWKGRAEIIERLNNPQEVTGWNSQGLQLADGRTVALPGIGELPAKSVTLSFAVKHGVELQGDRVYTLLEIYHWCGNDPVRKHWVRADLAHALRHTQEVLPVGDGDQVQWLPNPLGEQYLLRQRLWDPGAYGYFKDQEEHRNTFACEEK